jgi:hypothetical protein
MNRYVKTSLVLILLAIAGCTATTPLPTAARPGDTVVLPIGWNKEITRQNVTITITPASGTAIVYGPNDPNIRTIVNMYPDPASRLVVGTETQQSLGVDADIYGGLINDTVTNQDRDWWQTLVYFDLPVTIDTGTASIDITGPNGSVLSSPATIEILPGVGSPYDAGDTVFSAQEKQSLLSALERSDHYTVTFTAGTVPHSIQVEFSHTAGIGKAWVVNPRGDLKNVVWSDNDANLKILLVPTHGETLAHLSHFKFYIAGGIADLRLNQVKAYDVNGTPITDINAEVN